MLDTGKFPGRDRSGLAGAGHMSDNCKKTRRKDLRCSEAAKQEIFSQPPLHMFGRFLHVCCKHKNFILFHLGAGPQHPQCCWLPKAANQVANTNLAFSATGDRGTLLCCEVRWPCGFARHCGTLCAANHPCLVSCATDQPLLFGAKHPKVNVDLEMRARKLTLHCTSESNDY